MNWIVDSNNQIIAKCNNLDLIKNVLADLQSKFPDAALEITDSVSEEDFVGYYGIVLVKGVQYNGLIQANTSFIKDMVKYQINLPNIIIVFSNEDTEHLFPDLRCIYEILHRNRSKENTTEVSAKDAGVSN